MTGKVLIACGTTNGSAVRIAEAAARILCRDVRNPVPGLRGVRLGPAVPGLMAMEVRAVAEAVVHRPGEGGRPCAEIMAALVGTAGEPRPARTGAERVLAEVGASGAPTPATAGDRHGPAWRPAPLTFDGCNSSRSGSGVGSSGPPPGNCGPAQLRSH